MGGGSRDDETGEGARGSETEEQRWGGCDEHCRSGGADCVPSTRYARRGGCEERVAGRDTAGVLIHKVA